ncbi:uncharacterized protein LOC132753303 [Ruditapes philippinarum]|uniref:uncharacterized protein LOC132753303 n=1 Tax=Ruditapes philippinarum TaxID=129788 RepID=UPI00295ADFC8|nr:uncharacterized protein LOC132753303 [Ruditapes philippinarum]
MLNMSMDISCILLHILMISACNGGGGGGGGGHTDCHKDRCVQDAIENIGSAFDEHLCHAFKDVDCSHHILIHDEMICATDGKTYRNHCEYANARCVQMHDKQYYDHHHFLVNPLGIVSHSACVVSTKHPTTPFVTMTNTPIVNTNTATSTLPIATATSAGTSTVSSTTPIVAGSSISSSAGPSAIGNSTTAPQTQSTTLSTQAVLGSVFCQYRNLISCGSGFTVVCGSDNNFYPNKCELLKTQCTVPTLREESDVNKCSVTP